MKGSQYLADLIQTMAGYARVEMMLHMIIHAEIIKEQLIERIRKMRANEGAIRPILWGYVLTEASESTKKQTQSYCCHRVQRE
jgi:hypothetical protein